MRAIRGNLETGPQRARVRRTDPFANMRRCRRPLPILLFLLAVCACTFAAPVAAVIPPSERQALLDLYTATQGAGWRDNTGWTGAAGTECSWFGVRCDGAGERVVAVVLDNNRLTGTLPSLAGLAALEGFSVSNNALSGPIPPLASLRSLQDLFVGNNALSGEIPSLAGLSSLRVVYAYDNALSGPIPSLAGLTALQGFAVYNNRLTGSLPSLSGLPALVNFNVGNNALSGPIPSIAGLVNLRGFVVDRNRLSGNLPALSGLTVLDTFNVANNALSGPLPSLAGLRSLLFVFAENNALSGEIPSLAGLTSLKAFYAYNNALSGPIPSLAGLTALEGVALENNQLTGSLPAFSGLPVFVFFNAGNNALSGPIPSLAGAPALKGFLVYNNRLSGSLPALSGLSGLDNFNAANNDLSGPIPPLAGLRSLLYFLVDNNALSGEIPSLAGLTSLRAFYAYNNALSGPIPSLAGLSALEGVALENNRLTGTLPALSGLPALVYFNASNNALTGPISTLSGAANLQGLYVYGNQLSGPVPTPAPPRLSAGRSRLCPNLLDRIDNAGWDAATGVTPWWRDCTVNPNLKVSGTLDSKTLQQLEAPPGAADYAWIVDGDGSFDRSGTQANLQVRYPTEFNSSVSVRSRGSSGATTTTTIALRTEAPRLVAFAGTPVETCGNGDGVPQPGERFNVPLGFTNQGAVGLRDGYAMFAAREQLDAAGAGAVAARGMTVETPLLGIGALAPQETKPSGLDRVPILATVAFDAGAACGSTYGLRFTGSVDRLSFSKGQRDPIAVLTIPSGAACRPYTGACDAVAATPASKAAPAVARQGLYFNPERPGNGLSNFLVASPGGGTTYFGLWFTAGPDRIPTWYLIQGPKTGNSVVAPIYKVTRVMNAATFTIRTTIVGQAQVVQKGAEQLFLYWQIGSRAGLESMSYLVSGPVPNPNRTGAWYNPAESGWGQVVHQFVANGQVNSFKVDFVYDDAGEPRWLLAQGTQDALTSPLPHFSYAAHCPGCPWISDWNDQSTSAGTGSQTLLDATNGRTTTRYTLPAPIATTWNRDNLPLILLTDPQ
jgi:Leucine-rich repeat (LRR) protein